jgi:hypothetical protein
MKLDCSLRRSQQPASSLYQSQVNLFDAVRTRFFTIHCKPVRVVTVNVYELHRVRPSVRMYQRGSHWTNFREIWDWGLFMKIYLEIPSLGNIGWGRMGHFM